MGFLKRHPVLAAYLVWTLLFAGGVFLAERAFSKKYRYVYSPTRYVRLREYRPFYRELPRAVTLATMNPARNAAKEFFFRTDRDGLIMPSAMHAKPDRSILFLGDSTTESFWVDEDYRFPYATGRLLEKASGLKINSYNGAVQGNTTIDCLNILLNKGLPLNVSHVVWMGSITDLTILVHYNSYWNDRPERSPLMAPGLKQLIALTVKDAKNRTLPNLYTAVYQLRERARIAMKGAPRPNEFQATSYGRIKIDKRFLLNEFQANLQTLIDICRARKITPILMTQPNLFTPKPDPSVAASLGGFNITPEQISYEDFREIYFAFNDAIRETGRKNRTPVIDLAKEIPADPTLFMDALHLNEAGSRLVSQVLSRALLALIKRP